jgi:hypothetical protein
MYLDLVGFIRLIPDAFAGSLVLRIDYGDIHLTHRNKKRSIDPFHYPPLFQLRPEDFPKSNVWDFSIHVTNEKSSSHEYYSLVLRREGSGVWVARYSKHGVNLLDLVLPDFNPHRIERMGTLEPRDVWARLVAD